MRRETFAELIGHAKRQLREAGIETASLDARLLLQAATGFDHATVVAEPDRTIDSIQAKQFSEFIARRLLFEPVSKILGFKEFYGRRFKVSCDVLDPRPDTETLIALCLKHFPADKPFTFIDLGSGSGAIGVTLACERPLAQGVCVDISQAALQIVSENAARLGVASQIKCVLSDWYQAVSGSFDLIVSNPPYISSLEIQTLAPDVRKYDPWLALDGGVDGLAGYSALASGAAGHLLRNGQIVVEIGTGQGRAIEGIFSACGYKLRESQADLAGITRVLSFGPVQMNMQIN